MFIVLFTTVWPRSLPINTGRRGYVRSLGRVCAAGISCTSHSEKVAAAGFVTAPPSGFIPILIETEPVPDATKVMPGVKSVAATVG